MGSAAQFYRGVQQDQIARDDQFKDAYRTRLLDQYQKVGDNISQAIQSGQIFDPTTNAMRALTPEEKQQLGDASGKVNEYVKNLNNPKFDPNKGMVPEDPVHGLLSKLHLVKPTPKPGAQQLADIQQIRQKYAPAQGQEEAQKFAQAQSEQTAKWPAEENRMRDAGYGDTEIKKAKDIFFGIEAKPRAETVGSDYKQGLRRYVESQGGDPDNPSWEEEAAFRKLRAADTKPRFAWSRDAKGKVFSVKMDANNQVVPGTENYDLVPPAAVAGSITTGQYHFTDDKGLLHSVTETRTRTPLGGGGGGAAAAPRGSSAPSSSTMAIPNPKGLIQPGNIDLAGRKNIPNPDGKQSTVFSTSFEEDGKEILVPRAADGKILTEQEAKDRYHKTGEHLGIFDNPENATAYAQQLHKAYETGQLSAKKSLGQQKQDIQNIGAKAKGEAGGGTGKDKVIGFKGTKNLQDARLTYHSAIVRDKIMHDNAIEARHGNQQAMVSLLMNHIGMTLGLQKGTRVTQTIIDEAQRSDDAWSRMVARLGVGTLFDENSVGGLFPKGVVLDDKQIDQMVGLADQRVQVSGEDLNHWESDSNQPATPIWKFGQETPSGNTGGGGAQGGKKRHSLKKAMALPINKGKSEAAVRADLEKHGYEVAP